MSSPLAVSRNLIVLLLCVPLALIIGYVLAEPLESGSLAVLVMLFAILAVPILMRWHHPLLIFSWNAVITPTFIPGQPGLWIIMAGISFLFAVLNRSVNPDKRFVFDQKIAGALAILAVVVVGTAFTTGGIGLKSLGSRSYGGRGYFYLAMAIIGYFALASEAIPVRRAKFYVGLFFLPALTAFLSNLVYMAGPQFYFLYYFIPPEFAVDQAISDLAMDHDLVRISGVVLAAYGAFSYLLSRYSLAGIMDFRYPWRFGALMLVLVSSMFGGFRSAVVLAGLTLVVLFFVEKLWQMRFLLRIAFLIAIFGIFGAMFLNRMPLSIQRTLSFLPFEVDMVARQSADSSTEWRLEMWKQIWPEVPRYLWKGKGYAVDGQSLDMISDMSGRGRSSSSDIALFAGDYHNGFFSIIIPFGIWGILAFLWFIGLGGRKLYRTMKQSPPELQTINTFLFAFFLARALFFFAVFGALSSDLVYFTGILGFSAALNAGALEPQPEPAEENTLTPLLAGETRLGRGMDLS